MGGRGSGRHGERVDRPCVEQFLRLTLSELLENWRATVKGYLFDDETLIVNAGGNAWALRLESTRHRWAGKRRWMLCPKCSARCSVLYLRGTPACRRCHGLTYFSKTLDASYRALRRLARS